MRVRRWGVVAVLFCAVVLPLRPAWAQSPQPTPTKTIAPSPTPTKTPAPTMTPTPQPTATSRPRPTVPPSPTPVPTATPLPATPVPTNTPVPTRIPPSATPTPSPTATATPTGVPTPTATPWPTATPTCNPSPTAQTPKAFPSPSPTHTLQVVVRATGAHRGLLPAVLAALGGTGLVLGLWLGLRGSQVRRTGAKSPRAAGAVATPPRSESGAASDLTSPGEEDPQYAALWARFARRLR